MCIFSIASYRSDTTKVYSQSWFLNSLDYIPPKTASITGTPHRKRSRPSSLTVRPQKSMVGVHDSFPALGRYSAYFQDGLLLVLGRGHTTSSPKGQDLRDRGVWIVILLMEEILHQLIGSLSLYLQGFTHPKWCRISSINSMNGCGW